MRALIAARVKCSAQSTSAPPPPRHPSSGSKKWVHKLYSKEKWSALQTAVPCLHPSHSFSKIIDGPERAIIYDGSLKDECVLDAYLHTFPPSKCSCADVAWIEVVNRMDTSGHENCSLESRIDDCLEDWESLVEKRAPRFEDVDELARKYRITKCKWLAFPSVSEVDAVWATICRAVVLQDLCMHAKISSVASSSEDTSHVLCCYSPDYLDTEVVTALGEELRCVLSGLLSDTRLLLKPDIYTYLGLYKGNAYKIRPTISSLQIS